MDLFSLHKRIARQRVAIQVFFVHIHRGDLMVVVGRVIVDAFIRVAAGSIDGDLILAIAHIAAAPLLVNRAENMEELADACRFRIRGYGVQLHKGHPYKAGLGGQISREAHGTHAAAVLIQFQGIRKAVVRVFAGQMAEIVQPEHLLRKRRIVGQRPHGIIMDMDATADVIVDVMTVDVDATKI